MSQTLIGLDYAGVPSVKITKGNIDPASEPDGNVGSFLYNSKWSKDYKIAGIDLMPQVGGDTFWPPGAGLSNYSKYSAPQFTARTDFQWNYFRSGHFPDLNYSIPLVDIKARRISNGRFVAGQLQRLIYGPELSGARRNGVWYQPAETAFGWGTGMTVYYQSGTGFIASGSVLGSTFRSDDNTPDGEAFFYNLSLWDLPGNNVPITDGAPVTPISGATVIQIDSAGARVAKPGFDLNNITRPSQLAFDSARSPTKIIGSGDIACPFGVTNFDIGVTIPPNAQADVHFYSGSTIAYPMNPTGTTDQLFGAEYWFEGSLIRFNNPNEACRARFVIYANSTEGISSGNNDVLRQFVEGGQDVVQILRPGAANPPGFADIVVDSRWPCIQILAEGYIPVGSGVLEHVVNFNGSGCFPMVKYNTVHGAGSFGQNIGVPGNVESWGERARVPFFSRCAVRNGASWQGNICGNASWCTLTQNQAVFRTYVGQPIRLEYFTATQYANRNPDVLYDTNPIIGIRYYILGIPA